jgi:hypothetical protein
MFTITKIRVLLLLAATFFVVIPVQAQEARSPIIDMHMHHAPWGPPAEDEQPSDWQKTWDETKPLMDDANVVLGLVSGSLEVAQEWQRLAPTQIIAGVLFPCDGGILANSGGRKCFENGETWPDIDWLRQETEAKRIGFLGEITTQYLGLPPNDPKMEPYYALAEDLDIPVLIHIGLGLPGAAYSGSDFEDAWCGEEPCAPNFRAGMSRPMLLEEVLIKHPRLRICVMHAGWPMRDEMINLLYNHPQVYVDIAILTYDGIVPTKAFQGYLQAIVDHGFGKRIMWGIDSGDYNDFSSAIEAIESADFLAAEQKRDIFYNNAAKFLRLTDEQIAAHHSR